MKETMKITGKEFQEFCESGNYYLSDIDYGMNQDTKEWDVPVVEWESVMGRYRTRYESEEARTTALDLYELELERWVLNRRGAESARRLIKLYENNKIQTMRTLGGQFPELELLKSKL